LTKAETPWYVAAIRELIVPDFGICFNKGGFGMKKSLLILTVIAVSLAFVGVAFAGEMVGCPAPVKMKMVPGKGPITPPKTIVKKEGCMTSCITVPGSPYYMGEKAVKVPQPSKKADVMRDLCLGSCKGQCQPCGFCVPVKWDCKWKTSVICGTVDVPQPPKMEMVKVPMPAVCKAEPVIPPPCY
jgi:hypothetical protein